jgi:ribosomal protein S18 acetylase RimI-like enzyme
MNLEPTFKRLLASDIDFLHSLCEATMRPYVEATFGAWNSEAVRGGLLEGLKAGGVRGIYIGDERVGAFAIEHHGSHIQIEQLFVRKEFQNKGIGTKLVRATISQGQARGKPVRLRVLTSNPSKSLYERLGFIVTEQTPQRYFMEYAAPTLQ